VNVGNRFQEALVNNPAPRTIGNVRLRYEESMLFGDGVHRWSWRAWIPELLLVSGFAFALLSVGLLLLPGTTTTSPVILGVLAALVVLAAVRVDSLRSTPLRFVLNFLTETLFVDAPGTGRFRRQGLAIPFDDVTAVNVVTSSDAGETFQLEVSVKSTKGPTTIVLLSEVAEARLDELQRFAHTLHAAFGIRPSAQPPPQDSFD
jgi:hypothetical protein